MQDNAGGKVQDTARGSGPLDLFGGDNTGKSPQAKAEDLVNEAQKPNPASSFLGGLFGIDEQPKARPCIAGCMPARRYGILSPHKDVDWSCATVK